MSFVHKTSDADDAPIFLVFVTTKRDLEREPLIELEKLTGLAQQLPINRSVRASIVFGTQAGFTAFDDWSKREYLQAGSMKP